EAGRENQDAALYRRLDAGFLIAVADGAGSRSRSALGAHLAVEAAADAATAVLSEPPASVEHAQALARQFRHTCLDMFTSRLQALLSVAPDHQPGDYATTLLAVVAHPPFFISFGVGDCFMVVAH